MIVFTTNVSKPINYYHNAFVVPSLPDYGKVEDPVVRAKYAYLQSGICLGGNIFLLSSKLYLAIIWSSVAVLGDALNHLADVAVSIIIILAFAWSKKAADAEHPHGHGRIEHILAVVVATLIIFMGIMILREAIEKLSNPTIEGSILFAGLMVIFAIIKGMMAALSFSVAKKIMSNAVKGDAWNHTTDVLISASIAGAIFATTFGSEYKILDPIFGILVAVLVMYAGIRLIYESASILIGEAPPLDTVRKVQAAAMSVDGVRDAHDIEVHDYGTVKIVSLHIIVDEHISANEAHRVATMVERSIKQKTGYKPTTHVEVTEPKLTEDEIRSKVSRCVKNHRLVKECVDVNIHPRLKGGDILLTLAVDGDLSVRETDRMMRKIEAELRVLLPHYRTMAKSVPHGGARDAPSRKST